MSVEENLRATHKKIEMAAQGVGRDPASVQLVAVSKVQPEDRIDEALTAGQRLFGENRVQEAQAHWHARRAEYPDLELHLIGPLQTNKAKEAVALFDVIETLDREKLARALAQEMQAQNKNMSCFIQVNTGQEEQKAGIAPQDLSAFYKFCAQDCGLTVTGLMCIPPVDQDPAAHFSLLKKQACELGLKNLSMGMSGDFETAIALGATHIRLGTAIFGARMARHLSER